MFTWPYNPFLFLLIIYYPLLMMINICQETIWIIKILITISSHFYFCLTQKVCWPPGSKEVDEDGKMSFPVTWRLAKLGLQRLSCGTNNLQRTFSHCFPTRWRTRHMAQRPLSLHGTKALPTEVTSLLNLKPSFVFSSSAEEVASSSKIDWTVQLGGGRPSSDWPLVSSALRSIHVYRLHVLWSL